MAIDTKIDYIAQRLDVVVDKVADMSSILNTHVVKFEDHIKHEDGQREELKRNTDILNQNTGSLQDHIKRTELLEDYVKKIDARFTPVEMEALRQRAVSDWIRGKIIFLGKFGAALGAIGTIFAILKYVLQLF